MEKPISRPVYNELVNVYRLSMKMLSFEFPKEVILNFFGEKKIKKLYRAGGSRIGEFIISVIENEIECVTYRTGNVRDCDAAFISSVPQADIKDLTGKLKTDKPIYTLWDINRYPDGETLVSKQKISVLGCRVSRDFSGLFIRINMILSEPSILSQRYQY